MKKLSTECRARHKSIVDTASELGESFLNGNKSHVLNELKKYNKVQGMCIVALMMGYFSYSERDNLRLYLLEVAL